jgi:hypothetical protein
MTLIFKTVCSVQRTRGVGSLSGKKVRFFFTRYTGCVEDGHMNVVKANCREMLKQPARFILEDPIERFPAAVDDEPSLGSGFHTQPCITERPERSLNIGHQWPNALKGEND